MGEKSRNLATQTLPSKVLPAGCTTPGTGRAGLSIAAGRLAKQQAAEKIRTIFRVFSYVRNLEI
jgi:hypothetical protein